MSDLIQRLRADGYSPDSREAADSLEQATKVRKSMANDLIIRAERIDQLEAGIRQIQENYMKRGLIKRLTSQLLAGNKSDG